MLIDNTILAREKIFLFAWLLACLPAPAVKAQGILRLQNLSVEDGLSQSSVYSILQDAQGFMWFATGDGLNRYDGKDFVVFKSRYHDSTSFGPRDRNINSNLIEDKNGRLWMATDAGISFFEPRRKRVRNLSNEISLPVGAITLSADKDTVWYATTGDGIFAINTNNLKYSLHRFTDRAQRDSAATIHRGIGNNGELWIVDESGLLHFSKKERRDKRVLWSNKINDAALLHDGRLLVCSDDGFFISNHARDSFSFVSLKNSTAQPMVWRGVAEDTCAGAIYLGTANTSVVCKLNTANWQPEFLNFANSPVNCLFIDRSQNLWVGTDHNGVYKLDIKTSKFACYAPGIPGCISQADGLMVNGLYRDDSGIIWMGSYSHGLITYNPSTRRSAKIEIPFSPGDHISTVFRDSSGDMVVSVESHVYWLNSKTHRIVRAVKLPRVPACNQDAVIYSLIEWKKNRFLAATNLGSYIIEKDNNPVTASNPPLFRQRKINQWTYNLFQDRNGTIYAGQRSGYTKFALRDDLSLVSVDSGFEDVAIRGFYKSTAYPVAWMATEQGLFAYNENTKKYSVFDERSGLANSFVYSILPQNDSVLWISTNTGIARVDVQYGDGSHIHTRFTCYTSKDGLQSDEFNTGASFKCTDGTMIFGGIAGINWFRPDAISVNPYKPQIAIASIGINDSIYATDNAAFIRALVLPYNRNTISFALRSLEYTNPERNQFAYKLEGLDNDWVYTANDKVRYAALPPGKYNFQLRASNSEGTWNNDPLTIEVTILPPYWQTWWFRLLALGLASALAYSSVRYYIRQRVKARTIELEKQQALNLERLRISKDVHDDLGAGLSKISLMAEIAQKRMNGNETLSNDIKHISVASKELVENMRDLIWVLNPEHTTLDQLIARLREYCADYLENMPIDVSLEFPDKVAVKAISREVQRNIFLTVKEAVNNTVKHSGATAVNISAAVATNKLIISIADNGTGFDTTRLRGSGNGLRNMRQRIEGIGGSFEILSASGNTTVRIEIPVEKLCMEKNTTLV